MIEYLKESGALLDGHFLLSSGKHSSRYIQCAKLLSHPDLAEKAVKIVADQVKDIGAEKIIGPAMGGVVVSYELARQLNLPSMFTEREDGVMKLRRGFEVSQGEKVIISEDVITTGKSSLETLEALEEMGAEVIALICLVDRRGSDKDYIELDAGRKLPIYSAIKLEVPIYDEEYCPMCKEGSSPIKPGSRKFAK